MFVAQGGQATADDARARKRCCHVSQNGWYDKTGNGRNCASERTCVIMNLSVTFSAKSLSSCRLPDFVSGFCIRNVARQLLVLVSRLRAQPPAARRLLRLSGVRGLHGAPIVGKPFALVNQEQRTHVLRDVLPVSSPSPRDWAEKGSGLRPYTLHGRVVFKSVTMVGAPLRVRFSRISGMCFENWQG